MTSFAAVNIHLSYRNAQVLALSIPIVDIKRLSIRPLKWLRYVAFTVFGAIGHLALTADGSAVEDENITWESQDRLCEDYYYIPDGELHLVDYQCLNDRITSSATEPRLPSFSQSIIQRDGDFCVFTETEAAYCEAIHILPKCKGDEYIQTVHQDRRHAPILESIDCDENGILVRSDLHKMHAHGAIAFLKTPNFALNPEDIPRVEEGNVPTSPRRSHNWLRQSAIILDFVYGVAALKHWSRGPDVEKMMREHFEAVYESIPPRPRPSPEFSDDDIRDDDPNDDNYEPQRSGTGSKHRRRHTDKTSDSMLQRERTMEEAELRRRKQVQRKLNNGCRGDYHCQ
ncbi:hypothetical protein IW261DRAFT_1582348 [Armillaria novae-zelandiae]|uniref:HNH nuclease domain-containing protein n=1 Tax=Armillaria novae-zelandiae TaxID=153914 RepID=A0AA39UEV3_9AGAR|nr:hypothetical protein IW261DRAFT_1582348 [Armillaria novae-zelandiae]